MRSKSRRITAFWVETSSAEVGSSAMTTLGSSSVEMLRCVEADAMKALAQALLDRFLIGGIVVALDHVGGKIFDLARGVERVERSLGDHGHFSPEDLAAILLGRKTHDRAAVDAHVARRSVKRREVEAHAAAHERGLAAPRFAR